MIEGRWALTVLAYQIQTFHTTVWFLSRIESLAALYMSHTKTPLYNLADTLNWKYDYATQMRALLLSIGCVNGAKHFLWTYSRDREF